MTTNPHAVMTLASLTLAGCLRYPHASGHLVRTATIAACLADLLGLDAAHCERIRLVTPAHDVGKLAIPDAILLKPGKLLPEERQVIERHAEIGANILAGSADALMRLAAQVAHHHHERFDGTGYPRGLAGKEIPLAARIVALADAFDAMTESRCYRPGMSDDDALSIVSAGSGTHFDPGVASVFLANIPQILQSRQSAQALLDAGPELAVVARFYGLNRNALRQIPRPARA
ncbi:HD-GYP domain-containing protein [Cupriavidus sp. YAF13]|uniref:HD-GYP domain-containing protein n=1 Tax=Cupriavidus sp. YAF13 TaxID=3233075 RepID=UPI003F8F70FD